MSRFDLTRAEERTLALTVSCPVCSSPPTEDCTTPQRYVNPCPHTARVLLAAGRQQEAA